MEGQSGFLTITNLSRACSIKKCLNQHFSDVFLYQILLYMLQYGGVTFYATGHLNLFKT